MVLAGSRLAMKPATALLVIVAIESVVLAWQVFVPPIRIIIWPDSIGYLRPSLDALSTGAFTHAAGRGFAYPLMLLIALGVRRDPLDIVILQGLMAVATLTVLGLTALMLARDVRHLPVPVLTAMAAFWLTAYAFYPPIIGLTHIVMPETLFAFTLAIVAGGLVLVASPRTPVAVLRGGVAVSVVGTVGLTAIKPHAALAALLMPLLLFFVAPLGRRRQVAVVIAPCVVLAALVVVWPESWLQNRYDLATSRVFGPRSLFCNSADLMRDTLAADSNPFADTVRLRLDEVLSPEARAQAGDWPLLGFDGDRCTYGDTATVVSQHFAGDPNGEAGFYIRTYLRGVLQRPQYLVIRWFRHARSFVVKPFNAVAGDYFFRADPATMLSVDVHKDVLQGWYQLSPWRFTGLAQLPTRGIMFAMRVFFVLAGAALVLSAALTITRLWLGRKGWVSLASAGLVAFAVAINVLVATVHTFEPRYLAMQVPLWAMIGFSAVVAPFSEQGKS